jgi:hypothetical protein
MRRLATAVDAKRPESLVMSPFARVAAMSRARVAPEINDVMYLHDTSSSLE